jgi:predicted RecB family nuclease
MQLLEGEIVLSATDLTGFLECEHLTQLELKAAKGLLVRPVRDDPELDILTRRGGEHEQAHLARLRGEGRSVVEITSESRTRADLYARESETVAAMRAGAEVIYQATFFDGRWRGHADFLLRVETPSDLGAWSYQVADTKLARKVKTAALLQMSNYSEQLSRIQGTYPHEMHVVLGTGVTESFAVNDFAAYYRAVKARYEAAVTGPELETYPDPVEHCGVCRWRDVCVARRRADDHLSLVAGMRRDVTRQLVDTGVSTVVALAETPPDIEVDRVGRAVLDRLRHQAQLQLRQRESGRVSYELLPPQPGLGLGLLPAPSPGDLFFDMEGDPFAGEHGLEYLFGVVEVEEGTPVFRSWWGHDPAEEKAAFEGFMDFVMERLQAQPDLHIYHYAAYEPGRLKSLMGRYGTREEEVDRLLRGGTLVDLYQVVRQSVRVSQESYSIKKLEPLYMGARQADIADAGSSVVAYEQWLESRDSALLESIERYNEEDCVSTWLLRNWLEARRLEAETDYGSAIERPAARDPAPSEGQAAAEGETAGLVAALTADVPEEPASRTPDQHGRWLLAQLLGWHRREARGEWWEYFRRCETSDEDLVSDPDAIGQLSYKGEIGTLKRSTLHRYRFDPTQFHKLGVGDTPHDPRTRSVAGSVHAIDNLAGTIDLKRVIGSSTPHPLSLIPATPISRAEHIGALARVAADVIRADPGTDTRYRAVRDLLALGYPRVSGVTPGEPLAGPSDAPLGAAVSVAGRLDASYLPVQGPPGSGKTWVGARMIIAMIRSGKQVGLTATSHKAILNLLEAVHRYAVETGTELRAIHRCPEEQKYEAPGVRWAKDNGAVDSALAAEDVSLIAGTSWLFAREAMDGRLDALFVDEAGQMSLADAVAVGTAATNLVLLGDPQQLAQPSHGLHPSGAEVSALDHVLVGTQTIESGSGLFLDTTYRMHPDVCKYISEIAYEDRLTSAPACKTQRVGVAGSIGGTGVRYVAVEHVGNRTASREEVAAAVEITQALMGQSWTDMAGQTRALQPQDVLVMAPYNAQVDQLDLALPAECAVGTVDRFQGQEAPIVIYSLTTSSADDMPRQMEFLYSLNRLNVAISRARGLAILLAAPGALRIRCRNSDQMRLANAFCLLLEHDKKQSGSSAKSGDIKVRSS